MLGIVPARGGSRGVPRKCLRVLGGRPLVLLALDKLRDVGFERIVCSTDDDEIAAICGLHGYEVHRRPTVSDTQTVGEAVAEVVRDLAWTGEVGVFQPTSPCLRAETIRRALDEFDNKHWDSLVSVVPERHILWDDYSPLVPRVNRQQQVPLHRETGGIQLARCVPVGIEPLMGRYEKHCRFVIPEDEAIDIDTLADLEAARGVLHRKHIEFWFADGHEVGTGHRRRCEQLAAELAHHEIVLDDGRCFGPDSDRDIDLIVFDKLDTTVEEVAALQAQGIKVVTLEDLGPGSEVADLVVNELYHDPRRHALSGPKWAVLRPEFLGLPLKDQPQTAQNILVTFGGTDPARLAKRVAPLAARSGAWVRVVQGPGAEPFETRYAEVVKDVVMAEQMRWADLVITSAGRTVHEAAACGTPCISIAANAREARHHHANGSIYLGLWAELTDEQIGDTTCRVAASQQLRTEMARTAYAAVDGLGARRIAARIELLLEGL